MKANFTRKKCQREINSQKLLSYQRSTIVTHNFIRRLGLFAELEGHQGCVNCLEWNEHGSLLISGSDDHRVIVWDPHKRKSLSHLHTSHQGNIFSVKFLPGSESTVISGAADFKICIHDIVTGQTTNVLSCHNGRVKRLDTAPSIANIFWSASEDGTIRQFDLRSPDIKQQNAANVLINLSTSLSPHKEAKCLALNNLRPYQLAVGANDPYVRLYDRRMLSCVSQPDPPDSLLGSLLNNQEFYSPKLPHGCVKFFVAGHLPQKQVEYRKRYRTLASTYVTFSPDGSEMLVNLGGEQIYLFDVNSSKKTQSFYLPLQSNGMIKDITSNLTNGYSNGVTSHYSNGSIESSNGMSKAPSLTDILQLQNKNIDSEKQKLSQLRYINSGAEALKKSANFFFEKEEYSKAIVLYNEALRLAPDVAVLYGNRAASLMKRRWDGDLYAALRDCLTAIRLDVHHLKAHFRLARCFYKLSWHEEASECLKYFKQKFPDMATSHACDSLERDIKAALSSSSEKSSSNSENDLEVDWKHDTFDYKQRFCGHCNTTTDIKEANYFGSNSQCIVAGSDDGSFFIWDKDTTNIMQILRGDDSIVNCLQPHPSLCLLATSGIDLNVRLWAPMPEDGRKNDREVDNSNDVAMANQKRMNADPLEVILMNMGYRITNMSENDSEESEPRTDQPTLCRPS